jgi:hypothetical protein
VSHADTVTAGGRSSALIECAGSDDPGGPDAPWLLGRIVTVERVQRALVIRGYHGTSARQAAVILRDGFVASDNDYDCLGNGVYFFEDGLVQARAWARRAHPSEPAVVQADIRLDDCMDLKDGLAWGPLLAQAHHEVLRVSREQGLPLPRQTSATRRLDRVVIEFMVVILAREGIRIRVARGVFAEGAPAFPGSYLSEGSHVQVAMRDTDLISNVKVVPAGVLGHALPPPALRLSRPQLLDQSVREALKGA